MTGANCYSEIPPRFEKIVPRSIENPTIYHHQSEKCMDGFGRDGRGRPQKQQIAISGEVGVQDHLASLKPSMNQSDAATKAKGCPISTVAKSQLGETNTSSAMQPQSILIKEVKTEVEDVTLDTIHRGTIEGPPCHTTVIQGTIVSSSMVEEGRRTNGARCDHKTKKFSNLSDKPTCNIDFDFLQQVASAFEEAKANQEESTKLAKESISMNPSLEPTFLAIVKKHGDITSDCPLESGYVLTSVLEAICKVVQELQKKHLADMDCDLLNSYCSVVRDAEKMKVNVNWLKIRLDEIKDAVNCIVKTKKLNDEKNRLKEQINDDKKELQSMKDALEKLKSEIVKRENLLDLDTLLAEDMSSLINDQALRIQQFQNMPFMEAFQ